MYAYKKARNNHRGCIIIYIYISQLALGWQAKNYDHRGRILRVVISRRHSGALHIIPATIL